MEEARDPWTNRSEEILERRVVSGGKLVVAHEADWAVVKRRLARWRIVPSSNVASARTRRRRRRRHAPPLVGDTLLW